MMTRKVTNGSRRNFMKIATVGTAGAALGGATPAMADQHATGADSARYQAGVDLLTSLDADT